MVWHCDYHLIGCDLFDAFLPFNSMPYAKLASTLRTALDLWYKPWWLTVSVVNSSKSVQPKCDSRLDRQIKLSTYNGMEMGIRKPTCSHWLAMNKKTNSKRKEREILVVAETSKWYSQVTAMFLWILGENKNIINVCEHER
ncbi:hypothetical protein M514_23511 [Trichuris suis]|uniref:Uncharacterized protein n=1 Tax=Trichuris suis TaxID=68888 RepID=A0A085N4E7_9BILA|nr:hypothetical protein M514_23511 [Trichuris suis]